MINKLKNLIGGKSDGFFLELDETVKNSSSTAKAAIKDAAEKLEPTVTAAIEETTAALEPVTDAIKDAAEKLEPTVTAAIEETTAALEPVTDAIKDAVTSEPAQEKATKKGNKTSIKDKKKQAATASKATPASSNGASSSDQPFWVKAMYKNNGNSNGKTAAGEKTFATDNLLPTPSNYRRRPGPSLNKFKDMARQVKTPRR